jgi:hypothetical protein
MSRRASSTPWSGEAVTSFYPDAGPAMLAEAIERTAAATA